MGFRCLSLSSKGERALKQFPFPPGNSICRLVRIPTSPTTSLCLYNSVYWLPTLHFMCSSLHISKNIPCPLFLLFVLPVFFLFCANFNAITTRYCWVLSTLYNYVEISRVMELLVVVKAFIYNFSIGKTLRFPSTSTETSQASAVIYYLLSKL